MAGLLLVFDLSGLVHRAWHGQAWRAGRLAFDWMVKHIEQRRPTHVAAGVDRPWPTWRHDLAAKQGAVYKDPAKRTGGADRADIAGHVYVAETLAEDVLGMRVFGAKGFEGDDVVAALARRFVDAEPDGRVLVACRDKDFNQIVGERVHLLDFASGEVTRPADVQGRFGVPPERFRDYLALVGDKTDGYGGCPGIGPKAAVKILSNYNLDAALSIAERITSACAAARLGGAPSPAERGWAPKLNAGRASLELSRELATLRTDAPLHGLAGIDDLRAQALPEGL